MGSGTSETTRLLVRTDPPGYLRRTLADRLFFRLSRPESSSEAVAFGARMSVCITTSSLFVLAQRPDDPGRYPFGIWVIIACYLCCWVWRPGIDAGTVVETTAQHVAGSLVGAVLGIALGLLAFPIWKAYGSRAQAVYLGVCVALGTFFVCAYAVHTRVGGVRLIETKSYGVIICVFTFTVCLMPFYPWQWQKPLWWVVNVGVGSVLAVGLGVTVFPRSAVSVVRHKVSRQIALAGEASEAALHTAADIFAEKARAPLSLADEILGPPRRSVRVRLQSIARPWRKGPDAANRLGHEVFINKYEAAFAEWRATKSQMAMLGHDPFNIGRPSDLLDQFRAEVARTLARAMKIQSTAVLVDGIVRNDPRHAFSPEQLGLLAGAGALVRRMLAVPLDVGAGDDAERQLAAKLAEMRKMILDVSATVSSSPDEQVPSVVPRRSLAKDGIGRSSEDLARMYGGVGGTSLADADEDWGGNGVPQFVEGSHVCSLLFLQLAEHLVLRSVQLYRNWKQYDGVLQRAESLRVSVRLNTDGAV